MAKANGLAYPLEAVRVRVKKCIAGQPHDHRKFSVDPQITSFEILHSIIGKAFEIRGDFILSYRAVDDYGQEAFLPLLSDWDLDAAVVGASDPHLTIHIEAKPAVERAWQSVEALPTIGNDVFGTIEIPRSRHLNNSKPQNRLPDMLMNKMERTLNIFQRAFNMGEEVQATNVAPWRPPLTDAEFRKYLDPIGQINKIKELKSAIYYGGVEPSLRKVVWKHILNVYPEGMSGKERMDYMKRKTVEYEGLKGTWRELLQQGQTNEELAYVTSMVRKDVLRTDRHHKFYAGSDDNQNIAALFNILTTYSLNHPSVSYCQGMSDLASPLLVTMCDEAHAYICFCSLMDRLKPNFMLDGTQMTLKFQHLTEGLMQCDPQFFAYLKYHQAEDLLFCYRWLLLEMKREFAFDDALHMMEVLWSSIESTPPETDLLLHEIKFSGHPDSPPISPLVRTPRETPYSKVCAIRRQSSSVSLTSLTSARRQKMRENQSLDETVMAKHSRLRKQGRLKPFLSLDDNCMDNKAGGERFGDIDPLTLMKRKINSMKQSNKNNALSSSTGNLTDAKKRSPINEKSCGSLNKLALEKENDEGRRGQKKTVKNLNEFLTLSGRGRGWRSQCSSISESADVAESNRGNVTRSQGLHLEVNSFDADSDHSSLKRTSSYSSSISPNVFEPPVSDEDVSPDGCGPPPHHPDSSPDDSSEYCPVTTSMTRELKLELEHLDRQVLEPSLHKTPEPDVFIWDNPLKVATPEEQCDLDMDIKNTQDCEEAPPLANFLTRSALTTSSILHSLKSGLRAPAQALSLLPPPHVFGGGNPFLMFLCLTLLRQHRDYIMDNRLDYNEMAMHFDKMVRKHDVARVLEEARQMFASYLKQQSFHIAPNSKSCKV